MSSILSISSRYPPVFGCVKWRYSGSKRLRARQTSAELGWVCGYLKCRAEGAEGPPERRGGEGPLGPSASRPCGRPLWLVVGLASGASSGMPNATQGRGSRGLLGAIASLFRQVSYSSRP